MEQKTGIVDTINNTAIAWYITATGIIIYCTATIGKKIVDFIIGAVLDKYTNSIKEEIERYFNPLKEEIESIDDKVENHSDEMTQKVNELKEFFNKYRKRKHDIENENAGLKGTVALCSEAIDKAQKIIDSYEKK